MNHAGAAQTGAATELGTGELEPFPDHPQQRRYRRRIGRRRPAVHSEVGGHGFLLANRRQTRESDDGRRTAKGTNPPSVLRRSSSGYPSAAFTRAGLSCNSRMRLPVELTNSLATA